MSIFLTVSFHFLLLTSFIGSQSSAQSQLTCLEILTAKSGPKVGESDRHGPLPSQGTLESSSGRFKRVLQKLGIDRNAAKKDGSNSQTSESLLLLAIQNQFKVLDRLSDDNLFVGTKNWGDLPTSVRNVLESIPGLNEVQRESLLSQISNTSVVSGKSRSFKFLIELGLYRKETWINLISNFNESFSTPEARLSEYYLPFLAQNMPESLRNEVLIVLGGQYRSLRKSEDFTPYGPKREVDLYFKWLLRGDLLINREMAQGKSPSDAFEAYILEVQKYILPENGIAFTEIMEILRTVQSSIPRGKVDLLGMIVPRVIYVGGSVPNGRGFLATSDLDLSSRFPFMDLERDYIEKSIISKVKSRYQAPRFFTHIGGEPLSLWQNLHPVVIRVTPDGLEMLVFDPKNRVDKRPKYITYRLE
ncbi:MAG: hypothetical protein JNM39_17125 [Bdellovibrionaceae bacterium]|nr:hypothetical protein [Pseudobdellovibrionaceae bacterium]